MSLSTVWAIFRKEMRVYFVSPLAYVFLAVFLFLAGLFFFLGISISGEASLRVMVGNLAVALLFLLPMLTMRHFAEERRQGTFELLMTSPVSLPSLILGKWLASLTLVVIMLACTGLFPVILAHYGDPDWGVVFTSYVGLTLVAGAFCAAGLFSSSLTNDQVAAGMLGVLILLPFWLIGSATSILGEQWAETLQQFALLPHLRSFGKGTIDTSDIVWFVGFIFIFLFLTYRSLESKRWR
jgi:ABC-2 type transport system permease protein